MAVQRAQQLLRVLRDHHLRTDHLLLLLLRLHSHRPLGKPLHPDVHWSMMPTRLQDIWSEGCPEDDFDAIMPTSKGVKKERRKMDKEKGQL